MNHSYKIVLLLALQVAAILASSSSGCANYHSTTIAKIPVWWSATVARIPLQMEFSHTVLQPLLELRGNWQVVRHNRK